MPIAFWRDRPLRVKSKAPRLMRGRRGPTGPAPKRSAATFHAPPATPFARSPMPAARGAGGIADASALKPWSLLYIPSRLRPFGRAVTWRRPSPPATWPASPGLRFPFAISLRGANIEANCLDKERSLPGLRRRENAVDAARRPSTGGRRPARARGRPRWRRSASSYRGTRPRAPQVRPGPQRALLRASTLSPCCPPLAPASTKAMSGACSSQSRRNATQHWMR